MVRWRVLGWEATGESRAVQTNGRGFWVLKSCRCLWRGFSLHLMQTFCLYFTTRQAWHIFLTLDLTFIFNIQPLQDSFIDIMHSCQRLQAPPHSYRPKRTSQQPDPHPYMIHLRKKGKKSKDRKATLSLCSIQSKPSLLRLPYPPSRPRKVQSIHSISIRRDEENALPPHPRPLCPPDIDLASNRRKEKAKTLIPRIDENEERIKNCIQIMNGVLQDLKGEKKMSQDACQRKISRRCSVLDFKPPKSREIKGQKSKDNNASKSKENKPANIEFFIRCQPQGASTKPLIIKKGKSTSIVNLLSDSHIPERRMSKLHLGKEQSQSRQQATERKANISRRGDAQTPLQLKTIESFGCSQIHLVNQSSFISQDREEIAQQLCSIRPKDEGEKGRKLKISSRKIKNIFPNDFF